MTASLARPDEITHRCAVLGSPIAHSLSPALHRAAYEHLGLTDWRYERHEVDEAALPGFVTGCDQTWRGLSLTMPLKLAALTLGEPDGTAALVGAANTLIFDTGGRRRVHNTDVGGLVAAVRGRTTAVETVTLLGAGGTARAVVAAAAVLGAEVVRVVVRTPAKAEPLRSLAAQCGIGLEIQAWSDALPSADLLVSTVTAGAADTIAAPAAAAAPLVFDVIYHPWPTPLAAAALAAGGLVLNGLDLLVHQAVLQIELMTGRSVPAEVLLAAGQAALGGLGPA